MTEKFWQSRVTEDGYELEARSSIALKILDHFALVAARTDGEDSAGRRAIVSMSPAETVQRAFALADAFVDESVRRGEMRKTMDYDELAILRGRYEAIQSQVR